MSRGVITGSTAIVERLQAKVKQKDGEIELLQVCTQQRNKIKTEVEKDAIHKFSQS